MENTLKYLEKQLLKFYLDMPDNERRLVMENNAGDYEMFIKNLDELYGKHSAMEYASKRKGTDPAALEELALRQMKALKEESDRPRFGKKRRQFILRHRYECQHLIKNGFKLADIAKFLKIHRGFRIDTRTLSVWMETAKMGAENA